MYSRQILDHFEHPRNAGMLENSDASVQVENPACGDVLKLAAKITNGRIEQIKFQAKGCVPAIACGSALTELVSQKSISEASKLRREDLIMALGELPPASQHASHLAIDALRALIESLPDQTGRVPSGQ